MSDIKGYLSEHPSVIPLFLMVLVTISLMVFLGLQITSKQVSFMGKAADSGAVDRSKSSIWANQYSVKVDSTFTLSVFLHNSDNRAVSGKTVKLNLNPSDLAQSQSLDATSGSDGLATFSLTTKAPGTLHINAVGDGFSIPGSGSLDITIISK